MRRLTLAIVTGLLFTGGAYAQPLKKVAPVDTAAFRTQATALIKKAEAGDLFVPAASQGGPLAQHMKSNMVCHFEPGSPVNAIQIFDKGPSRGDDVGCATQLNDIKVTVFANRAGANETAASLQSEANAGVKRQWPNVVPYTGPTVTANDKDRPLTLVNRFVVSDGKVRLYVRTAALRLGDWIFTQKTVAPEASAKNADFYAEASLTFLYREVRAGRPL
jgi:hypothetical protein